MIGSVFKIIGIIAGLFVAAIVTKEIIQYYLDRKEARFLAEEYARGQNKAINKGVVEAIQRGNYNRVDIGLYCNNEKAAVLKIEVRGKIADDLRENDILFN